MIKNHFLKFLSFITMMLLSVAGNAQEPATPMIYDVVDVMPSFPGGPGALIKWLGDNIRYPKEAVSAKHEGRAIVGFVVEKDGSISNAKVIKSVSKLLDDEAVRVVLSMPKWNPGKQKGEPVRVRYTAPVSFKLSGENNYPGVSSVSEVPTVVKNEKLQPIFLLDGEEIDFLDMGKINPDDIQSISVWKHEQAIKRYGEKGKNGVVEIITKK